MNKSSRWQVYIGLILLALAIEVAVGLAVFRFISLTEKNSLVERGATIAAAIESAEVASLTGDESDLEKPIYHKLKAELVRIKEANEDVRFVYLTGLRDDDVFFYLDNEPADSPDNSPPGQVYDEVSPEFKGVFTIGQPVIEGPLADRWGTWITALAPVFGPNDGQVLAVAGIDVDAREYLQRVFIVTAAAVVLVGLLLAFLVVLYLLYIKEKGMDQAKSEFVSLVSHQLKTPITTISWHAEMLLQGTPENMTAEQKKYLEKICKSSWRMAALVNDFLNVSRIELGVLRVHPEPVNLPEVADSVLEELLPKIKEKKLQVKKNYEENLPAIETDPQLVRMIFQNLLSNAVKYTRDQGAVKLSIKQQDGSALIEVSDNGYGIPQAQQPQIFQKLFRADNTRDVDPDGTGLGLYIIKGVIERFGGKIWFKSEENKGTAFYVTIPSRNEKK